MSADSGRGSAGNVIAALATVFIPGLGQLIQGRILAALLFFVFTSSAWGLTALLFVPIIIAVPVHIWAIIDAATWKPRS
jgi:TM2 domain-containing membrane protein YozV